jgi:TolB protein
MLASRPLLAFALAFLAAPALGQGPVTVIAVPPLTTPDTKNSGTDSPLAVAYQASDLIASDLRSTAELVAIPPSQKDYYSYPEVTAPSFSKWRARGAKLLLTGFVRARPDGRLTFGCYAYDVQTGRELGRKGFAVDPDDWRRAAHKCSVSPIRRPPGRPAFSTPASLMSPRPGWPPPGSGASRSWTATALRKAT